jgi:hypothetical protein
METVTSSQIMHDEQQQSAQKSAEVSKSTGAPTKREKRRQRESNRATQKMTDPKVTEKAMPVPLSGKQEKKSPMPVNKSKKKGDRTPSTLPPPLDVEELSGELREKGEKLRTRWDAEWRSESPHRTPLMPGLMEKLHTQLGPGRLTIICLGLGHVGRDRTAQIQLVLMLELARELEVRTSPPMRLVLIDP